jgi:two-component system OmpR family sensor kinase
MSINTVRARLTFWYTLALSVVLLVFSAGVYVLYSRAVRDRLDGELRSVAQVTALALNHEIEEHGGRGPGEASVRDVLRTMHQTSFPYTAIAIWDHGRLVAQKSGLSGIEAAHVTANATLNPGYQTIRVSDNHYRLLVTEAPVGYIKATYQVAVNESLRESEADLSNLKQILLLSVPLVIILSAAAGYFLAQKSLRPVGDMAQTVERITSANLDERLAVANRSDEFGRLGETFNRLLDRLEQAFGNQQRFMADASHELRTPLSVALTAAQVTLQNPQRNASDLREAMSVVEEQLRRLKRIVEDMFILAQADAGAYQASIAPVYLTDIADEALRAARVLAREKNISVKDSRSDRDLEFTGDEGLLRQLMLILLDNAIKYTPAGGLVNLTLETAGDGYVLEISDNGPGIAAEDQPMIFERFYRSDKARSRRNAGTGSGAGLGLAIARWIASLHGGTIDVTSTGTGATFRVWLPHRCLSSV